MEETLGQRLRRMRLARKLSQTEVGAAAGVTQQAVDLIEKGQRQPTYRVFKGLARGLGVAPAELDPEFDPNALRGRGTASTGLTSELEAVAS